MFQALADPNRRIMVERLSRGSASVSELARPLPMSLAAVVQHFQSWKRAGWSGPRRSVGSGPAGWNRRRCGRRSCGWPEAGRVGAEPRPARPLPGREPKGPRPRRSGSMSGRSVRHDTFVIERTYGASPARVFRAWPDPEAKARWFAGAEGPGNGYELDFRVDGREVNRADPRAAPSTCSTPATARSSTARDSSSPTRCTPTEPASRCR